MDKNSSAFLADPLVDSHIHTRLCGHAVGEMEEYVQAALRKKLKKIIFLEHMEEGIHSLHGKTWLSEEDFDAYFAEGERLRSVYADAIEIGLGVECGYNPDYRAVLKSRLARRCWDQVGISCHFLKIEGMAQHLNMFSRKEENTQLARHSGTEDILHRYFTTLIEAVNYLPGTMLCHLDGALRYLPEISLSEMHHGLIDVLLQAVKDNNLAIEINTSGIDIRGEQFPDRRILAKAVDHNIPFIFGSDAHKPEQVGRHFTAVKRTLSAKFGL
ncbi:histidinol-phosphatase HisJ family protein [Desulfopila sp. IMCC35006]|uniref:histidinol-phosphatase n=1 Tax=Desulfopila sp. IMCC35006 TaxID=2569542 RepID=UPI0010AD1F9E|nr:histidinol-phosphatase [Desulfopila sp. IMCC35006]TKB25320.1 histidinol-phosphatase HisJ family protein [Desulfopila sp. IMCC35006]